MEIEEVGRLIVDSAFQVHSGLGPGLLESAYQACLAHELHLRRLQVDLEVVQPVIYKGIPFDTGYRIDMLVDRCVVVENKCVEQLLPIHEAQLLTYLKLGGYHLGFLINWNVPLIKTGIKRMALNLSEPKWQQERKNLKIT